MARKLNIKHFGLVCFVGVAATTSAHAATSCPVTYTQLKTAVVAANRADATGFNNYSWAAVVNRQGVVCAVAFGGPAVEDQWLGSRQIAAAKAFTANAFSNPGGVGAGTRELSTAQLYQFVQSANQQIANPLFGLNGGNVMDATVGFAGNYGLFGTANDPLVGMRMGGTITFGGGLALYRGNDAVGGLGVSGDTACADHSVAWRMRIALGLQPPTPTDQLPFATNLSMTNGHPHCPNDENTVGAKKA